MLGRCDRMGRVSPWLPAAPTFLRRYKWRARELVPPFHTQKKRAQTGRERILQPSGLEDLAQHSQAATFPGMGDTASAEGSRLMMQQPGVLGVSGSPGCCVSVGPRGAARRHDACHCWVSSDLVPSSLLCRQPRACVLAEGMEAPLGSSLPWQGVRVTCLGAAMETQGAGKSCVVLGSSPNLSCCSGPC